MAFNFVGSNGGLGSTFFEFFFLFDTVPVTVLSLSIFIPKTATARFFINCGIDLEITRTLSYEDLGM